MKTIERAIIAVLIVSLVLPQTGSTQAVQVITDETAVFNRGKSDNEAVRFGESINVQDIGPAVKHPKWLDRDKTVVNDLNSKYQTICPIKAYIAEWRLNRVKRLLREYGHLFDLPNVFKDLIDETLTEYIRIYDQTIEQDILMDWRGCDAVYAIVYGVEAGLVEHDRAVQAALAEQKKRKEDVFGKLFGIIVVVAATVYLGAALGPAIIKPVVTGSSVGVEATITFGGAAAAGTSGAVTAGTTVGAAVGAGVIADQTLEDVDMVDIDTYDHNYQQVALIKEVLFTFSGIILEGTGLLKSKREMCNDLRYEARERCIDRLEHDRMEREKRIKEMRENMRENRKKEIMKYPG